MIDYVQHVLEIEEVKKEADKLMIAKVTKYENEIAELKKRTGELENSLSIALEINDKYQRENKELKEDNQKLAEQISDKNNFVERLRGKGLI